MNNLDQMKGIEKIKAKEINLKELYAVIKKRMWVVIIMVVITTLLGAFYSYSTNIPMYQASSRIIIGADPEFRNTLQVIIKDTTVLEKVVESLKLKTSPEALSGQINVASIDNSQVVSISVTDTDPDRAAKIANTTATVFKNEIPNIVSFNNVRLLSDAKVNSWPINQNQKKIILVSLIIGLVIGIGLVFLLDSLDDSIRSTQDVEKILGLTLLGRVPSVNKKNLKKKYVKKFEMEIGDEAIGFE
ncbi:Wzz/FepE/Etk N-terminal domain-containing protein [Neobacillus sp. PS3-40]|uniref:YveK family protein n=1 Tax=Neobacillus sp. PS3-40 TaxID=3070679 RepID=UPI0027DEAE04|nr:Wzz/FepE/Etk N-terminal domain-containing protein [Neobacillus sp. PS3-40]WML45832.1 Wzz/FepE/Etk N-terminal domain-containing protein [Neobacillus sp. PS3-40]